MLMIGSANWVNGALFCVLFRRNPCRELWHGMTVNTASRILSQESSQYSHRGGMQIKITSCYPV